MSDLVDLVNCPECGVKLRVKRGTERIKCSQCTKKFKRVLIDPTSRHPSEISSLRQSMAPPLPTESLGDEIQIRGGFFSFIWATYARTHSTLPRFFGFIFGFLLIPTLSFLKPLCGISTMISALGAAFALFVISTMLLIAIASYRYLFLKQRKISPEHRSWLSATICFLGIIISSLAIVSIAEKFGPDDGLLVKLVPQFKKEQVRLLGDLATSTVSSSSESTDSDASDGFATTDSSADEVAAILTEDDSATVSDETAATIPSNRTNLKNTDTSTDHEIIAGATESKPKPTKELSRATRDKEDASDASSDVKSSQVIAEGVGATAEEALKDAYRNAVRQVVGAVVDAETLITNDEVIDDKVLTYSGGFIKDYEEVAGSKKVESSLHRIKIKARVERGNVIAKLRSANITVKEVNGKGLFAEAVTKLEAEKDAAALLEKQFEGFPQSCITVTVIDEPVIEEKTAEKAKVKFAVQIEPDQKAYKAFSERLVLVLDKLSTEKGEFTVKYEKERADFLLSTSDSLEEWMPKLFVSSQRSNKEWKADQVTIVVAVNRTKSAESIDYKYFSLDPSLEKVLRSVAFRSAECKLQLLDADGEIMVTDRFNPFDKYSPLVTTAGGNGHTELIGRDRLAYYREYEYKLSIVFIAPVFGDTTEVATQLTFARPLTLSLDELKSVKDAKVEITFDE